MGELLAMTEEMLADTETPVSAYLKLCPKGGESFLFESGEAAGSIGRYSIVAWDPLWQLTLTPEASGLNQGGRFTNRAPGEFFDLAREAMARSQVAQCPDLPFVGSLAGYLGFDVVRLIEKLPGSMPGGLPGARLCFCSRFAIFDHLKRRLNLVALAGSADEAKAKIRDMKHKLRSRPQRRPKAGSLDITPPSRERYTEAVKKAKEYIRAGDIFQVVPSDRYEARGQVDPFSAYRWMRVKNPSPYMFFLDLGDCQLAGASPETLVKVQGGKVTIRPIAGTRGRSGDPAVDRRLEEEMLASEKERAEHVMLVDLARNDVGRVSEYDSVRVEPFMSVERFSHVMHITSQVGGRLKGGLDAWDAFKAGFPAGTVSGAPKVRAMEIICELEDAPRGAYAGAVGRFGPGTDTDTCIAIHMIQFQGDEITIQAGGGIVADSDPEMEFQEIMNKAAQGLESLKAAAEAGL